jgi:hypothetical protein
MTISRIQGPERATHDGAAAGGADGGAAPPILPEPFAANAYDDVFTSLAAYAMKMRHEQRAESDQERHDAMKEIDAATSQKIAEMHELAEDTFAQGLVEGLLEGAGALATGEGAVVQFRADTSTTDKAALACEAGLLSSGAKGLSAASRLGGAIYHRDQELDREAIAVADARIDRAKSAEATAASDKQRAAEDVRDLLNAIRSYVEAKTRLAEAGVFKG